MHTRLVHIWLVLFPFISFYDVPYSFTCARIRCIWNESTFSIKIGWRLKKRADGHPWLTSAETTTFKIHWTGKETIAQSLDRTKIDADDEKRRRRRKNGNGKLIRDSKSIVLYVEKGRTPLSAGLVVGEIFPFGFFLLLRPLWAECKIQRIFPFHFLYIFSSYRVIRQFLQA